MNKPRGRRKEEEAIPTCEVHAVVRLPKNRRINIDKVLDSLLDPLAIGGSIANIDAVFIRFYRGTGKGGAR